MDRKMDILDKAMDIVSSAGIDALTMSSLAKEEGLSKATLYHYFTSKEEILSEMMALGHRRLMKKGFPLDLGGKPEEILRKAAQGWDEIFQEEDNWKFLRVVFALHFTNRDAYDEYRSLSLMLSSHATVIVSAFPITEEKKRVLAPLFSSLLLVTVEKILEDEERDFYESLKGILTLIG